jgi:ribonucleoside-diphosphate reductase alpha chain
MEAGEPMTNRQDDLFNDVPYDGDFVGPEATVHDLLKAKGRRGVQQGGGIGYDFSSLRPKGAPVKGVGADASGPLSFMGVWDAMCRTIMSAGARRRT